MNIRPLVDRVFIKKIKTDKVGNLYIAESSKDKSVKGEVIAVGPFEKNELIKIEVGDIVFFPNWAGTIVSSDSEGEYIIVKAEEILGVEVK